MKAFARPFLFLLLSIWLASAAHANPWYVCPESQGEYGTENGTSLANCFDGNADWGASAASINPGDTVYFCGDWGPSDARITVADSGSAGNWLTLSGNAAACGRTTNSTISRAGISGTNGRAIAASNTAATRQYVKIADMTIRDCSDYCVLWDYSTTGSVADDTALWIDNVDFINCGEGSSPGTCVFKRGNNLTVTASSFDDCYEDCIYARGANVSVSGTSFVRISTGTQKTAEDWGLLVGGDGLQVDLTGVTDSGYTRFFDNYCDHTNMDVKYCFLVGPTVGAGSSVSVYNNVTRCPLVPENPTASRRCHPIYLDTVAATAVNVYGNYVTGGRIGISVTSAGAMTFTTRARVFSNVIVQSDLRGIWTDGNVDALDVVHNLIERAAGHGLYIGKAGASMNAVNNVFRSNATGLFYITVPTASGFNSYYGNTENISANGTPAATTTGDVTANPLTVSSLIARKEDAKLRIASPLRGVGTALSSSFTDMAGARFEMPRPSIGPYSMGSSPYSARTARYPSP